MSAKIKEYKCKPEEQDYKLAVSSADTIIGEQSLGALLEDMQRGYIVDDISMQRDSGQWSKKDMSLLVHTVLIGLSIAPISLDQEGTGDGVVKRLTDGKQRMNAFEAYKNNEFPLYKCCPPVRVKRVKMQEVLDENGAPKTKNKKAIMEPVVDENGQPVIEEVTYKVAGKRFSQLPDDLQYRFLKYRKMKQIVHMNYTEEETKLQMIRDNTSVKMTPAQIGMVASGEDLAQWLRGLREHDLFLNYSDWSLTQIKKSAQERCVVESSILAYYADEWNNNYATNNEHFIEYDSDDTRETYVDMLNDLANVISKYPELWKHLTKDNLHIIIAAYCHFCDMETMYAQDDFGKFLCKWFTEIKDTTEYEVEGNTGTKQKTTVLTKLSIIDEECRKYMEQYGTEITGEDTETVDVTTDTTTDVVTDGKTIFKNYVDEFGDDENVALASLALVDGRGEFEGDFTLHSLMSYKKAFEDAPDKKVIDNVLNIQNTLLSVPLSEDAPIMSECNLPILIQLYNDTVDMYHANIRFIVRKDDFLSWLKAFDNLEDCAYVQWNAMSFDDMCSDDVNQRSHETISNKYMLLSKSLREYVNNNSQGGNE